MTDQKRKPGRPMKPIKDKIGVVTTLRLTVDDAEKLSALLSQSGEQQSNFIRSLIGKEYAARFAS